MTRKRTNNPRPHFVSANAKDTVLVQDYLQVLEIWPDQDMEKVSGGAVWGLQLHVFQMLPA